MGLVSIFTSLFSAGAASVVKEVGDAIDRNVTTDQERGIIKARLTEAIQAFQLKMEEQATAQEGEITKRWEADAKSDSRFTKLVRPGGLVYLLVVVTLFAIADAVGYKISDTWVSFFTTLCTAWATAYIGSRGMEKGVSLWKKS